MNDDDKCRCGTPMPKGGGMCDSCAEMTGSYEEDDMASEEKTLTAREIAEKIISENPFGWPESEGVEELTPDQERHVEVIAEALSVRDETIKGLREAITAFVAEVNDTPEHKDSMCGCSGASDDCRHPPICAWCKMLTALSGGTP